MYRCAPVRDAALGNIAGVAAPCAGFVAQEYNFSGELPVSTRWIFPNQAAADGRTGGDNAYGFDADHLGSQIMRINVQQQESEVNEIRLDSHLDFDFGRFQFGVDMREMETHQRSSNNQMNMGNWGAGDAGLPVGQSLAQELTPFSLVGLFDDFSPGTAPASAWRGNATQLAAMGVRQWLYRLESRQRYSERHAGLQPDLG